MKRDPFQFKFMLTDLVNSITPQWAMAIHYVKLCFSDQVPPRTYNSDFDEVGDIMAFETLDLKKFSSRAENGSC